LKLPSCSMIKILCNTALQWEYVAVDLYPA
jgi:hypothetical protein